MEDSFFPTPEEVPFDEVLIALLNQDEVLDPLYLYRLSDITQENLSALLKIWSEIQVERRRALIEDLEELTDNNNLLSFESIFRLALKDEDEEVRFYAIRAIEVFDTDDLIPFFLSVLSTEKSVDLRAVTASVLGKYVYRGELDKIAKEQKTEIEDHLLIILEGEYPLEIQRRALEAISYSSRDEVKDHILNAYQSELEEWVASALFAMGRSYDLDYSDLVCDKLQHTSPKVRLEAVRACGELVLEDAVPAILDLLNDLPDIRETAVWALSQIGGEDAGLAIQELLEGEVSPDEEEMIQQALDRLDFLEDGIDMAMFNFEYDDDTDDEYILDDYDYQQDGYDDDYGGDDYDLEDFDIDDDLWLE